MPLRVQYTLIELGEWRQLLLLNEMELRGGGGVRQGQCGGQTVSCIWLTSVMNMRKCLYDVLICAARKQARRLDQTRDGSQELTLDAERAQLCKVMIVQVSVDPEQSSNDGFDGGLKVLGECHACVVCCERARLRTQVAQRLTNPTRESCLVIQHGLDPVHQVVDVFWNSFGDSQFLGSHQIVRQLTRSRKLGRFLVVYAVLPVVFESGACAHDWALLRRAKLGDGAILQTEVRSVRRAIEGAPLQLTSMLIWLKKSTAVQGDGQLSLSLRPPRVFAHC